MGLGTLLLNISEFLSTLWTWLLNLFTYQFEMGGLTISLWQIFVGLGVAVFVVALIINFIT